MERAFEMREQSFDHPKHSPEREGYSIVYNENTRKVSIHLRGVKYDLVTLCQNYATAIATARDFLSNKGVSL